MILILLPSAPGKCDIRATGAPDFAIGVCDGQSGADTTCVTSRPRCRGWQIVMNMLYDVFRFVPGVRSMRSILGIVALAWLVSSSPPAHSRGFSWFFAHSKPVGSCSGQHVVATYYVSGRRTASGQAFDPSGYTAAHRTLPFGSRVTVTNPQNGSSVTVVINDRGPFTRGVTLDLSRGAARAIGMRGTQWVCML